MGRYPLRRDINSRVSGRYPTFIAHTDSCARPKRSYRLRSSLFRQVFAACRHSLLRVGPSRRYLCESFSDCLDPYPGGSSGAFTRFFPEDIGLYQPGSGSALNNPSTATSVLRGISGLQSFTNVQASRFARHPGCTYRRVPFSKPQAAVAFTSTPISVRYLSEQWIC
jgi:hypothetical protein